MSECRRHILASHVCPMHILGGDRLELVMDYTSSKTRPLTISSRGIVWGQFSDLKETNQQIMEELAATPKNVEGLIDVYRENPDDLENLRLLTENLIIELERAKNNSMAHSLEFAEEKQELHAQINEMSANMTLQEAQLATTIDYWTLIMERKEQEYAEAM